MSDGDTSAKPNVVFNYPEEPLGLPAKLGLGFFQGRPGIRIGPQGRYELKEKLGYGTTSSVWLAKDLKRGGFSSIKILSGYCTDMNVQHKLQELDIYQHLAQSAQSQHCSSLLDHFFQPGIDEEDGPHLCLVLNLLRGHIYEIIECLPVKKTLPLPVIKRILRDVLSGLAFAHENGIAHTDIKPDNIMIAMDPHFDIEGWLAQNPPATHDPVPSLKGPVVSPKSQKFPPPRPEELSNLSFVLSDFSSAQFLSHETTDGIYPLGLRPPEIILGGPWDCSVDIWAIGNLAFYLLTLQALFVTSPTRSQLDNFWPKELRLPEIQEALENNQPIPESIDFLLYQMSAICDMPFSPALLSVFSRSNQYFEPSGKFKKFDIIYRRPLDMCLEVSLAPLSEEERKAAANFLKRCLQLIPTKRAKAVELLQDPWLRDV